MIWTSLLSVVLGLAWHTMVFVVLGGAVSDALSPYLLAGALAGWSAGRFTVRSRQQHGGEDRFLSVLGTYYLGFLVYWATGVLIGFCIGRIPLGVVQVFVIVPGFVYAAFTATLLGTVFIPLCYATRLLVWRLHVCMQPDTHEDQGINAPSGTGR